MVFACDGRCFATGDDVSRLTGTLQWGQLDTSDDDPEERLRVAASR